MSAFDPTDIRLVGDMQPYMTDREELRRNWRTNWLSSIQEFADEDTQRRLWLDPTNGNPHYSFGEYVCCYFDDLGLSDMGMIGPWRRGSSVPKKFQP